MGFILITRRNNHGFSIVELLVAMGLSLILLAGVATMFASSRGAYETNDRLARLEENGRFALDTMARDIRSAGYMGCSNSAKPHLIVNNPGGVNSMLGTVPVQGFNFIAPGTWSPALPGFVITLTPPPADGSDVLIVTGPTAAAPVALAAGMTSSSSDIFVTPVASGSGFFKTRQLLMIGDCQDRSYFEVSSYTPATGDVQHAVGSGGSGYFGNSKTDLDAKYGWFDPVKQVQTNQESGAAQLLGIQTEVFYVAPATASTAANPYNSLWRQIEGNPTPDELIEGVDSMQLLYGLDADGDGVVDPPPAETAPDPTLIVSVTISLLVRSLDQYGTLTNNITYYPLGQSYPAAKFIAPGDRRQRQVFSTTIWVRNPPTTP